MRIKTIASLLATGLIGCSSGGSSSSNDSPSPVADGGSIDPQDAPQTSPTPTPPSPGSGTGGLTDLSSHAPPSITLPAAGGSYVDPVFGSKIIRVTDEHAGTHCLHAYSYWPAFNADDTRLLISCDSVPLLYRFDPSTDTVTPDGALYGAGSPHIQFEGASWSHSDPNVLYAADDGGTRLWSLDVTKRGAAGYTQIVDLAGRIPGTIQQLTVSDDGDVWSFHAGGAAVVWVRGANQVYTDRDPAKTVNENKIDKAGRVNQINYEDDSFALWDFRAGTKSTFTQKGDGASGHYDLGRDFIAGNDGIKTGVDVRTYAAPRTASNLVQYLRPNGAENWTIADHVSLREDDEEFVIGSTYGGDGTWSAFENEIFLAYTDGHGFARLGHTRSTGANPDSGWRYYAQPRAVVDRLGHYVVYTSDLGSSSRLDVMILVIPPGRRPSP